jgi:hypothetical protein
VSWAHKLSEEEMKIMQPLMEKIQQLWATPKKELSGLQLIRTFIEHRIQPLATRAHYMWDYTGRRDLTRFSSDELKEAEIDDGVRAVTSLKKKPRSKKVNILGVSLSRLQKNWHLPLPPHQALRPSAHMPRMLIELKTWRILMSVLLLPMTTMARQFSPRLWIVILLLERGRKSFRISALMLHKSLSQTIPYMALLFSNFHHNHQIFQRGNLWELRRSRTLLVSSS